MSLSGAARWWETTHPGKSLVPRNILRSLALEHNNKQAMFGFSRRKCPWPAVIHRNSSETHVMPEEVLFWEYLVISSKLLPNCSTACNFCVNSAHWVMPCLSLFKIYHTTKISSFALRNRQSPELAGFGIWTLCSGVGMWGGGTKRPRKGEIWAPPSLTAWPWPEANTVAFPGL